MGPPAPNAILIKTILLARRFVAAPVPLDVYLYTFRFAPRRASRRIQNNDFMNGLKRLSFLLRARLEE